MAAPSRALLERVQHRDPEALGALFETYFDRMYAIAARLLGEHAAAEDAVQDVFLKVHRAAERIDPARDPFPWLLRITTNTCRDFRRSRAHRMAQRTDSIDDPAWGLGEGVEGGHDPESALIAREREGRVHRALERLPDGMRTAVLLRDFAGLTHEQIAAALGTSHATARKRYSRALELLGRLLEEGGE